MESISSSKKKAIKVKRNVEYIPKHENDKKLKELPSINSSSCLSCGTFVDSKVFFCPKCGKAHMKNILVENSTTANYDPITSKEWKEPHCIPIAIKPWAQMKNNNSVPFFNNAPWRPSMKNKDLIRLKNKKNISAKNNVIDGTENSSIISQESLNDPDIFYFKGQPFRYGIKKAGKRRRAKFKLDGTEILDDADDSDSDSDYEIETTIMEIVDNFHPLGIYEGKWLFPYSVTSTPTIASSSMVGYNIFISLLDRIKGPLSFQLLLRVGVSYEGDHNIDNNDYYEENSENGDNKEIDDNKIEESSYQYDAGEFVSLDFLNNIEGRLMTPSNEEWVDLETIDASEYYMTVYMQKVLTHISKRVKESYKRLVRLYVDQEVFIELSTPPLPMRAKSPERISINTSTYNNSRRNAGTIDNLIIMNNDSIFSSSSEISNIRVIMIENESNYKSLSLEDAPHFYCGPTQLALDKTIAKITCRIPQVHRGIWRGKSVLTQARMSLIFNSQSPLQHPFPVKADPVSLKPMDHAQVEITHVHIELYPMYSDLKIMPKFLILEVCALETLLSDKEKKFVINDIIQGGPLIVTMFLRSISKLFSFENTINGIKVMISGASCEAYQPSMYCKWPDEIDEIDEEEEAKRLAEIQRQADELKELEALERKQREEEEALEMERQHQEEVLRLKLILEEELKQQKLKELREKELEEEKEREREREKEREKERRIEREIKKEALEKIALEKKLLIELEDSVKLMLRTKLNGSSVEIGGIFSKSTDDGDSRLNSLLLTIKEVSLQITTSLVVSEDQLEEIVSNSVLPTIHAISPRGNSIVIQTQLGPMTSLLQKPLSLQDSPLKMNSNNVDDVDNVDELDVFTLMERAVTDIGLQKIIFDTTCAGLTLFLSKEKKFIKAKLLEKKILVC